MDNDESQVVTAVEDVVRTRRPHTCEFHPQQGNLAMCKEGHGVILPANKMLAEDKDGNLQIVDIVFYDGDGTLKT